jgi:transcriptional regulator with XRE-family HTH domain
MRRRKLPSDFGLHLRSARVRAGITLSALAARAGVSVSSLSRFEAGVSQPGFADACAIARAMGTPLLFLADGRDRTGSDPRDLIAHLAYWGLNDLAPGESALIGEARPFEGLIAVSLTDAGTPRILESIPPLLLKNDFSEPELEAQATGARVLHRLGWLAEVAEWIASQISVSRIHPSAFSKVRQVRQAAWNRRQQDFAKLPKASRWPEGWDVFGKTTAPPDYDASKRPGSTSPIAKKWKIAYSTPQEAFLVRARDILAAPESG